MNVCFIFLNGKCEYDKNFLSDFLKKEKIDFLDEITCFAADGGTNKYYKNIEKNEMFNNFKLKCIVGDLDSIDSDILNYYDQKGNIEIERFNPEKDFTDFELIIKKVKDYEIKENVYFEKIYVMYGLGGRIDMELSNLYMMEQEKRMIFLSNEEKIYFKDENFFINNEKDMLFSMIMLSEKVKNLTMKGFKYELTNKTMKRSDLSLLSNIVEQNIAEITFNEGKFLVILQQNKYK